MTRTHRRRAAVALALPTALLLSACGGNLSPQTDRVYNPAVGVNDRSGTVDVLNAAVVTGQDGSGTVIAGLSNGDDQNGDQLTGVIGAGRDSGLAVQISGGPIRIGPGGYYQLADQGNVTARGDSIRPGRFVTLTFSFARSESVTLDVPVMPNRNEFSEVPVPAGASGAPTATRSPSG